jgi:hypothetical protein
MVGVYRIKRLSSMYRSPGEDCYPQVANTGFLSKFLTLARTTGIFDSSIRVVKNLYFTAIYDQKPAALLFFLLTFTGSTLSRQIIVLVPQWEYSMV